ncbi:hypothetical protein P8C59_008705 [Phyllachora maydis]|uniref:Protein kinase domain-containing protein n=1 Tax=Phyllachora maydis TaxID=1825666 RepID=A0AAD9IBM1_9PEZI|nr:hypothetical protein P8C59_008705 [Phyllachora maydis]
MFSSALKSISSTISTNVSSNYSVSATAASSAGPWKIYEAKKKSTGKAYSVFVFDKKTVLDGYSSGLGRSSATAVKRAGEEVVERLKKEASSLARLRHPSVLELVEPVEETRGGGLQFVTEAVTTSLAGLLQHKDDQERSGGDAGGRSRRYVTEDADGTRRRREPEMDELEIQKGLLQISKALEFLHEKAGLCHANLTPDSILINTRGDWKLSGLSFCTPPENSSKPTSFQPINLAEVLHTDPRLPRFVQLNLDYTSPDFVLDKHLTSSADMFSLGLLCVALYNSPHRSPIESQGNTSTYKRLFQTSSTLPSANNDFLCTRPLPKDLSRYVLPRLITRRPAQRMTAKEFQQSEYFNNVLVSSIRFLEAFPAKTAKEKAQFLRGLLKVLPSFPKSVMEKKVLPALLEELKDRELVSLILHNVFKIIDLLPSGRRAFGDKIRPSLKEIFVTKAKQTQEKDAARDAGLMIMLEQLSVIVDNCNGKEFKDDILPIIYAALDAPTPSVVDAALRSLPLVLPVLDFSTIKNELFPVIATIFSRTTSLAIKVRGLQAFVILCGGTLDPSGDDGLDGITTDKRKTSSSSALDKYTMQEKIVPLVKGIKTKEPAVMMAGLQLLRVIGEAADADFVAMDILPILWSMSLGPLLDLKQFQAFMDLIRTLSRRVEEEQTKKLQELLGNSHGPSALPVDDFMSFGAVAGSKLDTNGPSEDDFERLVKGQSGATSAHPMDAGWDEPASHSTVVSSTAPNSGTARSSGTSSTVAFPWSTPSPTTATAPAVQAAQQSLRTLTPDLGSIQALAPCLTQFSQPLQPTTGAMSPPRQSSSTTAVNWAAATANPWASPAPASTSSFGSLSMAMQQQSTSNTSQSSSYSLPRPALTTTTTASPMSSFSLAPPPGAGSTSGIGARGLGTGTGTGMGTSSGMNGTQRPGMGTTSMGSLASMNSMMNTSGNGGGMAMGSLGIGLAQGTQRVQPTQPSQQQQQQQPSRPSGLDKYASLL